MQQTDFGAENLGRGEFESACRDFWLAYVMMETGERMDDRGSHLSPLTSIHCTSFFLADKLESLKIAARGGQQYIWQSCLSRAAPALLLCEVDHRRCPGRFCRCGIEL